VNPRIADRSTLGKSTVSVTALSLGTAPLGNLFTAVTDHEATAVVATALAAGIGYIDTAPHYGVGLAEERLGRALASTHRPAPTTISPTSAPVPFPTISTKVGRRLRPLEPGETPDPQGFVDTPPRTRVWDFSRAGIRASVESSLARLGLDRIDIALLHDPDEHEREVYESAYAALDELRSQGLLGAIGAGMNQSAMLTRFVRDFDLDVVLCAGRYTLLDQSALRDLLPECERRNTSVVIGGVYNSGLLADPKPGARFNYEPAGTALLEKALALKKICDDFNVPLRAAAVRFPIRHPAVASILVGCRSVAEVRDNAAMFEWQIPDALWSALADCGLMADGTP
jgi:D-threo-aldose 1-dehydrogenase